MRILMVAACPLPWPRGTPIRVHRMAEALSGHGHDVTVVTYPLGELSTPPAYRVQRIANGTAMAGGPGPTMKKLLYLDPLLCREVARTLRRGSFDIVHAHHYEGLVAALTARAAAARVPLVYDAHTLLASELPQYRLRIPQRLLGAVGVALDRGLPRRADHIIAVTERMQGWFTGAAHIAPHRVSLIPNGVEYEHFRPTAVPAEPGAVTTAIWDRPSAPVPRILFAGNLAEYQGIALLLDAFVRVRQSRRDAELVFVTGSDTTALRIEADRLTLGGSVRTLADDYARLPGRLAAADVLVNPRIRCDGLPQKLLNYMAAGRPIVSFAGSSTILEHDETALIVPDGDTGAFAAAVLRLLDDPGLGRRLADAARRQVIASHGWTQVAERVTSVYETVLGGRA